MLKKSFLFICFVVAGIAQSASNLSSNNIQKTLKAVDDLLAEDTLNWSDDVQNIYAKLAQLKVNALSDYHCHMFNRECTSPTPYIQLSKKYEELVAKLNLTLGEEDKVSFDSLQVWYDRLEVSEREKLKSAFIPQAHSLNVVQAPKNRKDIIYGMAKSI